MTIALVWRVENNPFGVPVGPIITEDVWGTRFSMLDCHVLKGFGIHMIGILDRRY